MGITVTDNEDAGRFEATDDDTGVVAGFADHLRDDRLAVYPHTEVRPEYEGRGIGGSLARAAMEDTRRRGLRALVVCPFLTDWLTRHPEYDDLTFRPGSSASD
ncbi:GNAT family N-acetyltransferase [Streptomyces avicenniae]|uniref:GNAT family N-acetyltransferase n=1 Tax=Streptomyces avicenniae TaxID=500153 RepID=UPI00069C401A|nr:GNAT family N-acetyltransferase [Streptomyces avicenniae]